MNETPLRITHFVPPWPHVLAERLELFDKAGLRVESSPTRSSVEQIERLRSGAVDVAVTAIDNLAVWNDDAHAARIRVVGMAERTTPLRVVGRSGLTNMRDLQGKVLGVDAPHNGFVVVLRFLLDRAGVTDFEFAEVGGVRARLDALLAGTIDATLLGPPFDRVALDNGMVILEDFATESPDFPGQGVVIDVTRQDALRPRIDMLLTAWQSASVWALSAPDEHVEAFVADFGVGADVVRAGLPMNIRPRAASLEMLLEMRRRLGILPSWLSRADDLLELAPTAHLVPSSVKP